MKLETTAVFAPGPTNSAWPGQILRDDALGLLVTVGPSGVLEPDRAATRIAVDALHAHLVRNRDIVRRFRVAPTRGMRDQLLTTLNDAMKRAAHETFAFARRYDNIELSLDLVLLVGREAFISHVGDGRVYLARRGIMHQLTVDHTDPSTRPPRRLRSMGPRPGVKAETLCLELAEGDRFLLCTSSLIRRIDDDRLLAILTTGGISRLGQRLGIPLPQTPLIAAAAAVGDAAPGETGGRRLAILAPMPLFAHCTDTELRLIAQATHPRRFSTGSVLFHQGDRGSELYLVIDGKIRIERDGQHIVSLGPGSNFGEMAMLDEPIRSATAIAERPAELLVVSKDAFFSLLRAHPHLAVKILWNMLLTLSSNLRRSTKLLAEITGDNAMPRPPTSDQPLESPTDEEQDLLDTFSGE